MDGTMLLQYANLWKNKTNLNQQLAAIKIDMGELEEKILSIFEKDGTQGVAVNGDFIHQVEKLRVVPKAGMTKEAKECLRQAGLADFITEDVKVPTLSKYVKECRENNEFLPESMKKFFTFDKKFSLSIRKE